MNGEYSPPEQQDAAEIAHEAKKAALIKKRNTILDSYLTQFISLREFVPPVEEGAEGSEDRSSSTKANETSKQKKKSNIKPTVGFFVGETVKITASDDRKKVFLFKLNMVERVFLTFHRPTSSPFSKILSNFMMIVIIISCVFFVISSDPDVKSVPASCHAPACENDPVLCPGEKLCEPVEPAWFFGVELSCIIVFTIDYLTRVTLVPFVPPRLANVLSSTFDAEHVNNPYVLDPTYSKFTMFYKYVTNPMNMIDLVAILPFYFGLGTNTESSVSVIRILRLGRMMRVFKVGKYNVGTRLLVQTVKESIPALSLLCFFTLLLVVLFGSLVFFAEGGEYVISPDFPEGAYVRTNLLANGKEESPFLSILVSCWWVIVTMTTVGYGDLFPTTTFGRLLGVCCMLIGILALALPIGVMGSAFNRNYTKFHGMNGEDIRRSPSNVAGLSCMTAEMEQEDMVYELNSEVVIRTTGSESGSGQWSDCERDQSDLDEETKQVAMTSRQQQSSRLLILNSEDNEREEESDSSERNVDIRKETALSRTNTGEDVKEEIKVEEIKVDITPPNSLKLSKKDIQERLKSLSDEIIILMQALEELDE